MSLININVSPLLNKMSSKYRKVVHYSSYPQSIELKKKKIQKCKTE